MQLNLGEWRKEHGTAAVKVSLAHCRFRALIDAIWIRFLAGNSPIGRGTVRRLTLAIRRGQPSSGTLVDALSRRGFVLQLAR